jgi:hypothetical protein
MIRVLSSGLGSISLGLLFVFLGVFGVDVKIGLGEFLVGVWGLDDVSGMWEQQLELRVLKGLNMESKDWDS